MQTKLAFAACLLSTTALAAPALAQQQDTPSAPAAADVTLPAISVYAPRMSLPAESETRPQETPAPTPHSDGGDFLRSVPGVTAGRFGGHGLEPVIRGQSQNQLNITANGATTYGACPNRMDPPSSYAAIESYDRIKVVRGYQSVLNGPGAPGGAVILSHDKPELGETLTARGSAAAGYDGNGVTRSADAYVLTGTQDAYARLTLGLKDAENYEDGDGNSVRSSFSERQAGFTLGVTPGDDTHIRLSYAYHDVEDALFPGAGMDSPTAETRSYSAGLEHDFGAGIVRRIDVTAYATQVDHVMDNFSLRTRLAAPFARVPSESDTIGGSVKADLDIGGQIVQTAIDYRRNNREAIRSVGPNAGAVTRTQAFLWPDITIAELGFAAETSLTLGERTMLTTGARIDRVTVDYGRPNERAQMTGRTANDLYRAFYGVTASDQTETNLSALARLEYDLTDDTALFGSISRSVRTADATERGLANDQGLGANNSSWVGNPEIDPEKHHQVEAGMLTGGTDWQVSATAYANLVDDYILRDAARGQNGILINSANADIYRNIDALLAGLELAGEWAMSDSLSLRADAAYTYGEDRDADRALPQIPPLQGALHLDWQTTEWLELGASTRFAARQTRVDTNATTATGRDVGKTGGYAVLDMRAAVTPVDGVELSAGVTNLLDATYANHLNRSNISDPTEVRVNEPGRSVFVRGRITF